jgi:hypothetical protein
MKAKPSLTQECSAAVDLLRSWGVLQKGEHYGAKALLPVIEMYAGNGWCYRFGNNLFEHLAKAAIMTNQWVLPGPGDPKTTLASFLFKTTFRATYVTRLEVVASFKEIAKRIEAYGDKIEFNHAASAEENVERAKLIEARHWSDHFLKGGSKGA